MKLLRMFEYVAAMMIFAGIVLSLGKAVADHVASMPVQPVRSTVYVTKPSEDELKQYLASSKQSIKAVEDKMLADMEHQAAGLK